MKPAHLHRTLLPPPAAASALLFLLGTAASRAAFVIPTATGLFTPSFRDGANTTRFGWTAGTWDGNADAVPPAATIPDIINGIPPVNPGGFGTLLTQTVAADIVSGSDNIYSGVSHINTLGLQLRIPTSGVAGSAGFTTIIIQGLGMGGSSFGVGALDGFRFGSINGIAPTQVFTGNADSEGQWWAKWELPGNETSYTVDILGAQAGADPLVVSVTDLMIDTQYSATGFAPDTAVPEPSTLLLAIPAAGLLTRGRRR